MEKKTQEETIKRVEDMQQLYEQVVSDKKELGALFRKLQKADKNLQVLSDYYSSDWMTDQENVKENYPVLGQDAVWEELVSRQVLYVKILRFCTNALIRHAT
jgi:hypothetical protein